MPETNIKQHYSRLILFLLQSPPRSRFLASRASYNVSRFCAPFLPLSLPLSFISFPPITLHQSPSHPWAHGNSHSPLWNPKGLVFTRVGRVIWAATQGPPCITGQVIIATITHTTSNTYETVTDTATPTYIVFELYIYVYTWKPNYANNKWIIKTHVSTRNYFFFFFSCY